MEVVQKTVHVQDLDISYYQAGDKGQPVILLHGGGADSAMLSWREALPVLGKHFRVFAPDWPGYGGSQELPGEYSLDTLAAILKGLMDHWGLEKANLVGLSMGGGAVLGFALAYPERLEKIILVDSYGFRRKTPNHRFSYFYIRVPILPRLTWRGLRNDKGLIRGALRNILANHDAITDEFVDEIFEAVQNPAVEQSFYLFQRYEMAWEGFRHCFVDRLSEIQAPTLFIHGEQYRPDAFEEIERAMESMPDATVTVMKNTGQWAPREHPEEFNQLVIDFLQEKQNVDQ